MTDQERIAVLEYELEAAKKRITELETAVYLQAQFSPAEENPHDISGTVVVGMSNAITRL